MNFQINKSKNYKLIDNGQVALHMAVTYKMHIVHQ